MKFIFLAISLFFASNAMASQEQCYDAVFAYYQNSALESSDWGFEALEGIEADEAEYMINEALWDMNSEEDLLLAKKLVKEDGKVFFNMFWTAPSNSGNSVIIVDAATCSPLAEIGIWSEE